MATVRIAVKNIFKLSVSAVYALDGACRMDFINQAGQRELLLNDRSNAVQSVKEVGEMSINIFHKHE